MGQDGAKKKKTYKELPGLDGEQVQHRIHVRTLLLNLYFQTNGVNKIWSLLFNQIKRKIKAMTCYINFSFLTRQQGSITLVSSNPCSL